ncbi:MAG: DUF3276 family protein [Bacteroidota bacterium]|jgi:hypothetical protein
MEKDIPTIEVQAGKRTYLFNINFSENGEKYLQISEHRYLEKSEDNHTRIIFYEEDIKEIASAFNKSLKHFTSAKSKMELTKEKYINAYKPWKESDDEELELLFCQGKKVKELSEIFQRNRGAIQSRIKKLELKEKYEF